MDWCRYRWTFVASLLCACTSAAEPHCTVQEDRVTGAALTNGTARAEYLKLEPRQEDALVAILAGDALWCSGVLVSERLVVTAKHCMKQGTPDVLEVMFGHGPSDVAFLTGARILAAHPDQDVLVLELSESPVAAIGVEPLEIVRTLGSLEAGGLVQLGGFGLDQATTLQREFVVAEIQSLSSTSVTVSAAGLGGACFGDSGGPLLVRSQDGHAGTLGVLDAGSASCAGVDLYTRLDTLIDWLPADARLTAPVGAADAGLTEPVDRPYQSLGQEGRCFGTTAVWTDADQLDAMHCEAGRVCGWSEHSGGFRCVESGSDPCSGVDDLGRCEDGVAVQCTRGQLTRNACKACGFTCARSPKTGRAICLAP